MADFASIRFVPERPLLRELSADRLNSILAEIKRNKPKGERGITVRQDGNQTWIGLAASLPRGTSAPATPQPWDLIARQDPDNENQYLVTVRPGTLNGFLPTNWNAETAIATNNTSTYYAKALIFTDGTNITSVQIAINTTQPATQAATAFGLQTGQPFEYLFGLFKQGSIWRTIGAGHITLTPRLWLTKEKESAPQPGELPYVNYYAL